MAYLKSTRRRILGGLCGLGIIPVASQAQTEDGPKRYSCTINSGTADGTETTQTLVTGTSSTAVTRQSSELKILGKATELFAPLSKSDSLPFRAEISLYNYSGVKTSRKAYPEDIMIRFSGFDYDGVWPEHKAPKVTLIFDFGDGEPVKYFADVNKLEVQSNAAYFLYKLSNHTSESYHADRIFRKWDKAGSVAIIVMGSGDETIWLKTKLYAMNWEGIQNIFKQNYQEAYAKMDAGYCPEAEGCFLTTAAAGAVGLADDCWELKTLRRFRDGPMTNMADGAQMIETYYNLAPEIVAHINKRQDARAVWLRLYIKDILPAALLARWGLNQMALQRYEAMTRKLMRLCQMHTV